MKIVRISSSWCSSCIITYKNYKKLQEKYPEFEYEEFDFYEDEEVVNNLDIGNILPVPFILWLIKRFINWMRNSGIKLLEKIVKWLDKKVKDKKGQIEKYGFWGLVLFVGIPLPGTGAWTGCLIAAMLDMDKKKSFLAAAIGVLMAGIIMSVLSIGIFDGILG